MTSCEMNGTNESVTASPPVGSFITANALKKPSINTIVTVTAYCCVSRIVLQIDPIAAYSAPNNRNPSVKYTRKTTSKSAGMAGIGNACIASALNPNSPARRPR